MFVFIVIMQQQLLGDVHVSLYPNMILAAAVASYLTDFPNNVVFLASLVTLVSACNCSYCSWADQDLT